ncbi:MAG: hypothetical protein HRJ53_18990 [Acidobacteria bacterium Pan2503]|uniref:MucB/RseB N-terminal domain-containing protein n=1 Tax=Candidatus Acidiferrum panamense TaxID=2741543 RepID=A0A7V8SY64_9BACT|nr:hypothetical protein [Candidatus Acidoferrum panamensis]
MFRWIWRTFLPEDRIAAPWCALLHDSPRWHINGHYECSVCGRPYLVPWAEPEQTGAPRLGGALPSLHSAIRPVLVLMAVVAWPSLGRESVTTDASAAAVFERFIGSRGETGGWPVETIQIEASLPRLKKTGRLRAIRRVFPIGQPDYKVLEIAGDATVKNQVIVRYISADEKATELAPSSVALTPANYKIHYAGTVWLGNRLTYAFRVIPRKKREGLINGVLWLDGETGVVVREFGYLAKSPSVFVKRINLTRENELNNGTIAKRITHVSVETRLIGRAQLVIVERPYSGVLTSGGAAEAGQ